MAEQAQPKWERKLSAELAIPTAQEVWPFLEDFCSLHKWVPGILDTSHFVDGIPGQPGLIRYCASTKTSSSDGHEETTIAWVKEKLIMIDPIQRCLSYETMDNNIGMKSYVATIKVLPINDEGKQGCKIEWSFVCDPVEGWGFEEFVSYIEVMLSSLAKNIEDVFTQKEKKEDALLSTS